jgi:hypothetical protein
MVYVITACQVCGKLIKTQYARFRCCSLLQNTAQNSLGKGSLQKLRIDEVGNQENSPQNNGQKGGKIAQNSPKIAQNSRNQGLKDKEKEEKVEVEFV